MCLGHSHSGRLLRWGLATKKKWLDFFALEDWRLSAGSIHLQDPVTVMSSASEYPVCLCGVNMTDVTGPAIAQWVLMGTNDNSSLVFFLDLLVVSALGGGVVVD